MTEALNTNQNTAGTERLSENVSEKSRENFRRLEAARDAEKEARIRAEMEAEFLKKRLDEIANSTNQVEADPLDSVEDYVDAQTIRAKFDKERKALREEASRLAKEAIKEEKLAEEKKKREEEQKNSTPKLRSQFNDYDEVMNEENILRLEQDNPTFLNAVLEIQDEYKRKYATYDYLKKAGYVAPKEPSIKEKVEENRRNPYYFEPGSGTPIAVDFDVKSPQARQQAYEKLKQAQRRPIGGQAL
jgi:hypothetical protein